MSMEPFVNDIYILLSFPVLPAVFILLPYRAGTEDMADTEEKEGVGFFFFFKLNFSPNI